MRYDEAYSRRAARAVAQGNVDLRTFMEDMLANGVSADSLERMLLEDLETGGPIFGKFTRSLTGAAQSAVSTAERQGDLLGMVAEDEALHDIMSIAEAKDALEIADPDVLHRVEQDMADRTEFTWVCTLDKTCYRCLPQHGTSMLLREWEELGLHPDTVHAGWTSTCECILVPTEMYPRDEIMDPLVRKKMETTTGLKGSKKTVRQVAQKDLERARRAVDKARQTKEGRRTLRIMGSAEANNEQKEN